MIKNMGSMDRIIRIVVGVIVIILGIAFKSLWGGLGLIMLLTSAVGWCPLYAPFKISTMEKREGI